MKNTSEFTMEVTKRIGKVGDKLQLNMISWNGAEEAETERTVIKHLFYERRSLCQI